MAEQMSLFEEEKKVSNNKDWTGSGLSVFTNLGASNHTEKERQANDYYATDPKAAEPLLEREEFSEKVWEPACGEGHLAEVFKNHGHNILATDLIYRGYGYPGSYDFLKTGITEFDGDIVTNPPYKFALEFVQKALEVVKPGHKVAMFLKIQFLEGKKRREFYQTAPPRKVYVFTSRINCAMNGDFEKYTFNSAVCYAWFIWEKGFTGDPVIKWI